MKKIVVFYIPYWPPNLEKGRDYALCRVRHNETGMSFLGRRNNMPKFLDAPVWYSSDGNENEWLREKFYFNLTPDDFSSPSSSFECIKTINIFEYPTKCDLIFSVDTSSGANINTYIIQLLGAPGVTSVCINLRFIGAEGRTSTIVFRKDKPNIGTTNSPNNFNYRVYGGYLNSSRSSQSSVLNISASLYLTSVVFGSGKFSITPYTISASHLGSVSAFNGIDYGVSSEAISFYAPIESGMTGQILKSNGSGNAPTWQGGPVAHYISVKLPVPNSGNLYFTFFDHDATTITTTNVNDRLDFSTSRMLPASGTIRIGSDYAIITHVQLFAGSFTAYGVSFSGSTITTDNYSKRYGVNEVDVISDSVLPLYS